MAGETPSRVMYADLKRFGRISNYDAARMLLTDRADHDGRVSPRSRIEDRTYLSRQIVNASPGQQPSELFEDFSRSAQAVLARILATHGSDQSGRELVERHYAREAPVAMSAALERCGIDSHVYRNLVSRAERSESVTDYQRTVLLVMIFLAMGCLASPAAVTDVVSSYVRERLRLDTDTMETTVGERAGGRPADAGNERLALMRMFPDGSLRPAVYPLSTAPEGTVVGSLACEPGSITDVDADVSRRHLRISWRDGAWLAEGLGSTNGSALLAPGSSEPVEIEPPRSARREGRALPRRIRHGDILALGATTRFLVIRVSDADA